MLTLPRTIIDLLAPFAQVFSTRIWDKVQVLVVGAILTPGQRTVCAILRTMGLSHEPQFQNYHRVLSRAKWSGLKVSQILLGLLVATLCAAGVPVVLGADETLERRQGRKIKALGVFRDAVRSSQSYTVHAFGLRWISMMLFVPLPWSSRLWALPFLTVLAPSEKSNQANGLRHKTSLDWIMQMISAVRRWQPERALVLVTDGGLCAVKLGLRCLNLSEPLTWVSRLRLDAALHDWPGPQATGKPGLKPKKGARARSLQDRLDDPDSIWCRLTIPWYGGTLKTLEIISGCNLWYRSGFDPLPIRWVLVRDPAGELLPTAFLCTDLEVQPEQILAWFIQRWGMEVTFQECRTHLGLETQRQWSDLAIARTTPILLGLFSFVILLAYRLGEGQPLPVRSTAWYTKSEATFSDVMAYVRTHLWTHLKFNNSPPTPRLSLFPDSILPSLFQIVCYAT